MLEVNGVGGKDVRGRMTEGEGVMSKWCLREGC